MKSTLNKKGQIEPAKRGRAAAVTLPVEIYSDKRIREFDESEAELKKVLSRAKKAAR